MKTLRPPQLALRLDAPASGSAAHWCSGAPLAYLGGQVSLRLDTDRKGATLEGAVLHLPLPPEATERQVRDAAEAWLRKEAQRVLGGIVARQAARLGIPPPRLKLSFASRGSWTETGTADVRCNWRLIEQSETVIEQTLGRAIADLREAARNQDLFGAFA